jgi:putative transcriptional regulator
MSSRDDVRSLLPLYALGALDDDEARTVEAAISADPTLAAELDSFLALAPVAEPSPEVKARLLASVGGGRFEAVAPRLAALFDVGVERAHELLGLIERSASWETPIPGIHLVHFQGGPAYVAADCGFVRIDPGCTFPWHTHRGEEVSVILEGSMTDRDGKVHGVGEELVHGQGTAHDLLAGSSGVLYVARAMNGIEVSGQPR